ncbi:hypothetical protein HWV62_9645 [Athelia sp. TMB]|nr:hypothetical protein HWV62_9645 [Athelia sp. TMB]
MKIDACTCTMVLRWLDKSSASYVPAQGGGLNPCLGTGCPISTPFDGSKACPFRECQTGFAFIEANSQTRTTEEQARLTRDLVANLQYRLTIPSLLPVGWELTAPGELGCFMLSGVISKHMDALVAVTGISTNLTTEGIMSLSIGACLTNMGEDCGTDKGGMEKFVDGVENAGQYPDVQADCDVGEPEKSKDEHQHRLGSFHFWGPSRLRLARSAQD